MFSVRDRSLLEVAGLDLDLLCAPLAFSFFCTVLSMLSSVTDSMGELAFLAGAVAEPSSSVDLPRALIGASKSLVPGSLSPSSFVLESAFVLSTLSSGWGLGVLNGFLILPSRFEFVLKLKTWLHECYVENYVLPFITGGATITTVLAVGALGVPELGQLHQVGHHSWGGRKVVFRERKSKTRFTLTSLRGQ